jgi:hypothetical protein
VILALLPACCTAVVDRYSALYPGAERDGAALYCPACTSRIRISVAATATGQRMVSAVKEVA